MNTFNEATGKHEIDVFGLDGKYIETAHSFGDARATQRQHLPQELRTHYAGIGNNGYPLFYADGLTKEMCGKYNIKFVD